jgi:hypothetical protein
MNSAELIVALHADTNSALAKDIRLIERHEPEYLDTITDTLTNRNYPTLISSVFGKAGEIRTMGSKNCLTN